jgi:hypothetical protein
VAATIIPSNPRVKFNPPEMRRHNHLRGVFSLDSPLHEREAAMLKKK